MGSDLSGRDGNGVNKVFLAERKAQEKRLSATRVTCYKKNGVTQWRDYLGNVWPLPITDEPEGTAVLVVCHLREE